jgi:hypothetical protein
MTFTHFMSDSPKNRKSRHNKHILDVLYRRFIQICHKDYTGFPCILIIIIYSHSCYQSIISSSWLILSPTYHPFKNLVWSWLIMWAFIWAIIWAIHNANIFALQYWIDEGLPICFKRLGVCFDPFAPVSVGERSVHLCVCQPVFH